MARYNPRQNMQIPVTQNRDIAVSTMRFRNNAGGGRVDLHEKNNFAECYLKIQVNKYRSENNFAQNNYVKNSNIMNNVAKKV